MTVVSGEEADRRAEGGTSALNWGDNTWSERHESGVRLRTTEDGDHTLLAKADSGSNGTSDNHLHYFTHNETGERVVSAKSDGQRTPVDTDESGEPVYISEKLGNAVRNFMGW
jgi:hypothetical protein